MIAILTSEHKGRSGAISDAILKRKGAQKKESIPEEVSELLQQGRLASVNLTEWLAVDHIRLMETIMRDLGLLPEHENVLHRLRNSGETKIMRLIPVVAAEWLQWLRESGEPRRKQIFGTLSGHVSDNVRCWAAFTIGLDERLSLAEKLDRIAPFAADCHFGVREIAWMAIRGPLIRELPEAIELLGAWTRDSDENIRRFAIEATRPNGVWAKHIRELKEHPDRALDLLEAVKSDGSEYVQLSVGNWLNDAAKTRPEWVSALCGRWLEESPVKETKVIVKRALRSLNKKK